MSRTGHPGTPAPATAHYAATRDEPDAWWHGRAVSIMGALGRVSAVGHGGRGRVLSIRWARGGMSAVPEWWPTLRAAGAPDPAWRDGKIVG